MGIIGLVQPFNDAIKLFSKEIVFPYAANSIQYFLAPICGLIIVLVTFSIFPFKGYVFSLRLSAIFIYIIIRINVYPVLISGWASNSKYALLGSLRSVAQTVSYEVSLALILIFYLALSLRLRIGVASALNIYWYKWLIFIPIVRVWVISCLAETNRTPFDFAEGESELVSGFNIEYGSLGFALIFMAEYARILLIGVIFSLIFISSGTGRLLIYVSTSTVVIVWVWVRTTLPRYRYDKLINLAWKVYLPLVIFIISYRLLVII